MFALYAGTPFLFVPRQGAKRGLAGSVTLIVITILDYVAETVTGTSRPMCSRLCTQVCSSGRGFASPGLLYVKLLYGILHT